MEENFNQIKQDIIDEMSGVSYEGDLSDIGNHVGIVIGKYTGVDEEKIRDFISGLKHGISLSNGTH